jgi:hypothetical protein
VVLAIAQGLMRARRGLRDYWRAIEEHPAPGGGFLWVLVDERIVRPDRRRQPGRQRDRQPYREKGVANDYRWFMLCSVLSPDPRMPVTISCPQLGDATLRTDLAAAVRRVVRRWRPSFEKWRLALFRSQSGQGWDLAISGPRFRKVFTLYGPVEDLPGLVTAYVEAILADAQLQPKRT